jgi:hypothetical protein
MEQGEVEKAASRIRNPGKKELWRTLVTGR